MGLYETPADQPSGTELDVYEGATDNWNGGLYAIFSRKDTRLSINLHIRGWYHPLVKITEDDHKELFAVEYGPKNYQQPGPGHYEKWADKLEYFAKWCRKEACKLKAKECAGNTKEGAKN